MDKSEQINELAYALSKAQSTIAGARETSTNPFLKNKYADLGSVIEAARDSLSANGLAVSQLVESAESNVSLTTILMHSSGQWIGSTTTLPLGEDNGRSLAQNLGAIATYLRRYAYAAIVGVYSGDDSDAEKPRTANVPTKKTADDYKAVVTRMGIDKETANQIAAKHSYINGDKERHFDWDEAIAEIEKV